MNDNAKNIKAAPLADFKIGGGWGDAINWNGNEQFNCQWQFGQKFECHGWKSPMPREGQTLCGEFTKSWCLFKFVKVKPCGDPPDMFFATVRLTEQILK